MDELRGKQWLLPKEITKDANETKSSFLNLGLGFLGGPLIGKKKKVHLPMQGTQGQSLVQKDSTGQEVTKPTVTTESASLEPVLHKERVASAPRN